MDVFRGSIGSDNCPQTGNFLIGRLHNALCPSDLLKLESCVEETSFCTAGSVIVARGAAPDKCTILIDGIVIRTVSDGKKRQILGILLPGDFLDLQSLALGHIDHNLVSAGPVRVGCIGHERLERLMATTPSIGRAMWKATLLDGAIHRKWIEMLGTRDAPRRIAHILCELDTRYSLIGRRDARVLRTPFTQTDLADMCGVSAIHANRAVGKLRDMDLGEVRRGDFYPVDWGQLRAFADFDPTYLYSAESASRD